MATSAHVLVTSPTASLLVEVQSSLLHPLVELGCTSAGT